MRATHSNRVCLPNEQRKTAEDCTLDLIYILPPPTLLARYSTWFLTSIGRRPCVVGHMGWVDEVRLATHRQAHNGVSEAITAR